MKVQEIFTSIQGEGFKAGTPMTFIRLVGCNLACPGCDTPQDGEMYEDRNPVDVALDLRIPKTVKWVCITGGEPLEQEDELPDLVNTLRSEGHYIALETNGTNLAGYRLFDWICVSPKSIDIDYLVLCRADEIKVLVGSEMYHAKDFIRAHKEFLPKICVQPWWDVDDYKWNLEEALRLCYQYSIRLSVQLHKYLEIK